MAAGEADAAGLAPEVPAYKDMVAGSGPYCPAPAVSAGKDVTAVGTGGPYCPAPAVSAGKDVTAVGTGGGPHGPAAPPAGPPAGKGGVTEANSIDNVEAVGSTAWTEVVTGPAAV